MSGFFCAVESKVGIDNSLRMNALAIRAHRPPKSLSFNDLENRLLYGNSSSMMKRVPSGSSTSATSSIKPCSLQS